MAADIVRINGFDLTRDAAGEPLIVDMDVGRALGFGNPIDIRKLIRRNASHLGVIATVAKTPTGGRPATEYHLTEAQALFVASKSETLRGAEVLWTLIATCQEYRRMMAAPHPAAAPVLPSVTGRMGDVKETRDEMRRTCQMSASGAGATVQRVYGLIRRLHGLSSPFKLPPSAWPQMREMLYEIGLGRLKLADRKKEKASDPRQGSLFGAAHLAPAKRWIS
jgi:hypothetical protein